MSMLEKIESLINAPKKFPEQTKEWEKALDEKSISSSNLKELKLMLNHYCIQSQEIKYQETKLHRLL
jgi:hypothetical protein